MAKFFLRSTIKRGNACLYTRVVRPKAGISWMVNTGISVNVEEWNNAQKSNRALLQYLATERGKEVQEKMERISGIIDELLANGTLICQADKPKLDEALDAVRNAEGKKALDEIRKDEERLLREIVPFYDHFIEGITDGTIRQKHGKEYRKSSVNNWRNFGAYLKEYTPDGMTFDEVNKNFADGFVAYLERKGMMPKSINKYVLCYRRLCNAAAEDEKNSNLVSVKVWGERTVKDNEKRTDSTIALTDEEIDALYELKLTGIREEVRDVWMLGYFSGQRVSDYAHLTRDNFKTTKNGVDVIILQQAKTEEDVIIPITDERMTELCEKYRYRFPSLSTQQINRYIKEVLEQLAQVVPSLKEEYPTRLTLREKRKEELFINYKQRLAKGDKLDNEEMKYYRDMVAYATAHGSGEMLYKRDYAGRVLKHKYEMVSSHSARRSAVTAMYNSGLYDKKDMMSIIGHTTEKNFELYIKRGAVEQAERIAEKVRRAREERERKAM